ncbi:beta transducin [Fusarium napiforme]|uniref:Beta transducin n=1 Tax=Fusarium napiforme TaxID=42672 RepID=A0A8H5IV67_9HYPO|nr:beta transducin [Fusarium napiforme]
MRLVNTKTIQLEFLADDNVPDYAILSHTWEQEEVLFQDMGRDSAKSKKGYAKLESCCRVARENGFEYIWDDTCCIDKTSSAELSEAINSMYRYYQEASICYGYLADISTVSEIPDSRWFTRGWTLQELIAPSSMIFFDKDWNELGTKISLVQVLSQRTSIPESILCDSEELEATSIAQRMSWAADRVTTRKEDRAYSLMGIFGINMPLLYGEGDKAFYRLQEEIMRVSDDHSLFAWKAIGVRGGLLAPTPAAFKHSGDIIPWNPFTPTVVERIALSSLAEAASAGDAGSVWYLLAQDPSGTMHDEARSTICLAARGGHERLVSQLLARRDTAHLTIDDQGRTALSHAAECGQEAIVRFILSSARIHPDTRDIHGLSLVSGHVGGDGSTQTALWHAASSGDLDLVKLLLQNKALQSTGGEPALCAAVSNQHLTVTDLLLQHGADPDERDSKRRSPLHIACRQDNHEIVALLMRHGVNADVLDTAGVVGERGESEGQVCEWQDGGGLCDGAGDEEFDRESEVGIVRSWRSPCAQEETSREHPRTQLNQVRLHADFAQCPKILWPPQSRASSSFDRCRARVSYLPLVSIRSALKEFDVSARVRGNLFEDPDQHCLLTSTGKGALRARTEVGQVTDLTVQSRSRACCSVASSMSSASPMSLDLSLPGFLDFLLAWDVSVFVHRAPELVAVDCANSALRFNILSLPQ